MFPYELDLVHGASTIQLLMLSSNVRTYVEDTAPISGQIATGLEVEEDTVQSAKQVELLLPLLNCKLWQLDMRKE